MKVNVTVPDNFVEVDGVSVFVDNLPDRLNGIKRIEHDSGKTFVLTEKGDGEFYDDFDITDIVSLHKGKIDQLELAKQAYLNSWDYIRDKRNNLLAQSDWTQLPDSPLKDNPAWLAYRKALRDITENFDTPLDVVWPEHPSR